MTKKINRLARVFTAPFLNDNSAALRTRLQFARSLVASLNRHLFHFHRLAGPSIFTALFAFALLFRIFLRRSTDASLHSCFSRILALFFFLLPPLLTNPRKHTPSSSDTIVANRSRLRVTNVSGPIDVSPLFFCDRSLVPSSIVKFDEQQRLHDYTMIVNRDERTLPSYILIIILRNWHFI